MEIIYKDPKELIPYENNPRKNDPAVKAVKNSIKEFGFKVPIVIDRDGVIVTGHTRLKAALQLHMSEVPVVVADDLDEEQIKAFRLGPLGLVIGLLTACVAFPTECIVQWSTNNVVVELLDTVENQRVGLAVLIDMLLHVLNLLK